MQVSSRELAGKKLQGYKKRDITYEVPTAYLAKLLRADIHVKESITRGCQKGMCPYSPYLQNILSLYPTAES